MKRKKSQGYPRYMYPKGTWHRIPRYSKMGRMMVLRFMYMDQMPPGDIISYDVMKKNMRDSQFYEGLSVNLLSGFKKSDSIWWVDDKSLTDYWDFQSKAPKVPSDKLLIIQNPGYFGFIISDLEKIESTFQIFNDKGKPQRTDKVRCKVEHCPTRVNYWHYNIFLYGEKTVNNETVEYLLSNELKPGKVASVATMLMKNFYDCMSIVINLRFIVFPH